MQRKEMEALTAHLKEEDSKIEKVSPQIHSTKPTTQLLSTLVDERATRQRWPAKFFAGLSFKSVTVPKVESNTRLSRKSPWSEFLNEVFVSRFSILLLCRLQARFLHFLQVLDGFC
jgi:hypothetical protein